MQEPAKPRQTRRATTDLTQPLRYTNHLLCILISMPHTVGRQFQAAKIHVGNKSPHSTQRLQRET